MKSDSNDGRKPTALEATIAVVWLAFSTIVGAAFLRGFLQPPAPASPEVSAEMNFFHHSTFIGFVSGAFGIFVAGTAVIAVMLLIRFFDRKGDGK